MKLDRTLKLALVAPVLLVLLALLQQYLSHQHLLNPYKGAGFGMYTTIDGPTSRYLKGFVQTDQGEYALRFPTRLNYLHTQAATLPTPVNLKRLALAIARQNWVALPGQAGWATVGIGQPIQPKKIRVEFWRTGMDAQGVLQLRMDRSLEVEP